MSAAANRHSGDKLTTLKQAGLSVLLIFGLGCQSSCSRKAPESPLFDGFEGDSIAGFWLPGSYGSGRYAPGAVILSRDYARSARSSVRITVAEGNIEQRGDNGRITERAELDSGKHPFLNRDVWYGFSFLIPAGFPVVDNRLVIAQVKQNGVENPLVAQRFRKGQHYITVRTTDSVQDNAKRYTLPAVEFGRWTDMIYHVRYSSGQDGLVEVWMNRNQVVAHRGATAVAGGTNQFYSKIGLYRDHWKEPMTIYFDNYTLGFDRATVDPSRFDPSP